MKLKGIFIFLAGAATGAGATFFIKDKIDTKKCEERLESAKIVYADVRDEYLTRIGELNQMRCEKPEDYPSETPVKTTQIEEPAKEEPEEKPLDISATVKRKTVSKKKPIVISKEEYEEEEEYHKLAALYFSDGVVVDDDCNPIDAADYVGSAILKEFLNSYDDIYVRNFQKEIVIELTYSNKVSSEVLSNGGLYDENDY